jgi:hypothetical protein
MHHLQIALVKLMDMETCDFICPIADEFIFRLVVSLQNAGHGKIMWIYGYQETGKARNMGSPKRTVLNSWHDRIKCARTRSMENSTGFYYVCVQ